MSNAALPPCHVVEPKPASKSCIRIVAPGYVLVWVPFLVLDHGLSAVIGFVGGIGFVALLFAVEVPLISRAQDRRQARLMKTLPRDGIFVGTASIFPIKAEQGRFPRSGTITFTRQGVSFSPKRGTEPFNLDWSGVSQLRLVPMPRTIGVGRLTLDLIDGHRRVFSVPRCKAMARALAKADGPTSPEREFGSAETTKLLGGLP